MLQTRIPPPVYALGIGCLMWLIDRTYPAMRLIPAPWNQVGWTAIVLGTGIDVAAIVSFFRHGTTVNPMRPQATGRLVVGGLNSVSRNPMYIGLAITLSGWACLLGSPACWVLVWLFVRLLEKVQIEPEESALRQKFGASYVDYCGRVNRWIGRRQQPRGTS